MKPIDSRPADEAVDNSGALTGALETDYARNG